MAQEESRRSSQQKEEVKIQTEKDRTNKNNNSEENFCTKFKIRISENPIKTNAT